MTNTLGHSISAITNSKWFKVTTWSLVGLYSILLIFHGLDVTDVGYWLTTYNSFLESPDSIPQQFHLWLSLFIGGSFEYIFSSLGHFGHRILYLLIVFSTLIFSYKSTQLLSLKTHPLLWLATLILSTFWGTKLGQYFSFSMFFYTASFYLLILALVKKNIWVHTALGCLVALNVFVKLPNILGAALFTGVLLFSSYRQERFITPKHLKYYFLGIVSATCGTLALIHQMGHFELYIDALLHLFTTAEGSTSHGASSLLKTTGLSYAKVGTLSAIFLVIYIIQKKLPPHHFRSANIISLCFASSVTIVFFFLTPGTKASLIYLTNSLLLVGFLILLTQSKAVRIDIIALVTAMGILIVTPLGSNTGIQKSLFAYPVIIPLVVSLLQKERADIPKSFKNLFTFMLVLLPILSLTHAIHPYRDQTTTRIEFKKTLRDTRGDYIYSSADRVAVLQELLNFLKTKVKKGDKILAYEKIAMVYYYTQSHPWLLHPWPLLMGPQKIADKINSAPQKGPEIIVRSKYSTSNPNWPIQKEPLLKKYGKSREVIQRFIEEKSYTMIWENGFFEVFERQG